MSKNFGVKIFSNASIHPKKKKKEIFKQRTATGIEHNFKVTKEWNMGIQLLEMRCNARGSLKSSRSILCCRNDKSCCWTFPTKDTRTVFALLAMRRYHSLHHNWSEKILDLPQSGLQVPYSIDIIDSRKRESIISMLALCNYLAFHIGPHGTAFPFSTS